MSLTSASALCFLASLIIPASGFALGRAMGVSAERLSWVMLGFWLPALGTAALALFSVGGEATLQTHFVLWAETAVALLLVISKVIFGLFSGATTNPGDRGEGENNDTDAQCQVRLFNQGGGTSLPWSRSGESGSVGWYFWVANYYKWTLTLDIKETNSSATGTAAATGKFSAWHSVTTSPRTARSVATGNVACDPEQGCNADAQGGQDEDTDVDFTSAVLINGEAKGKSASLEVQVAAAVAGQVAISQISVGGKGQVGGQGGGVSGQVGTTIAVPETAKGKKKITRKYSYRCSSNTE